MRVPFLRQCFCLGVCPQLTRRCNNCTCQAMCKPICSKAYRHALKYRRRVFAYLTALAGPTSHRPGDRMNVLMAKILAFSILAQQCCLLELAVWSRRRAYLAGAVRRRHVGARGGCPSCVGPRCGTPCEILVASIRARRKLEILRVLEIPEVLDVLNFWKSLNAQNC